MSDLRLAISVDASGAVTSVKQFNAEVDKAPAAANRAGGAVSFLQKQFNDFTSGLAIGAGIAVANRALDSFVSIAKNATTAVLQYSDKMVTLAQKTGLSINSLQAFNAMAKTGGTDIETMSKAATLMSVAIVKGDDSFKKLGMSVTALKGMSPDEAFAKIATTIGAIEDPMQRAAAAVEIFGKKGAELLPVFANDMEAARKQAQEFGIILDKDMLEAVESLGDAVDLMGMAWDSFLMRIAGMVAQSPAILGFVTGLSRLFGDLGRSVEGSRGIFEQFARDGVGKVVDAMILSIKTVNIAVGVWESLIIIAKAAEIAFIGLGRAVLELDRMRSFFVVGGSKLRADLDNQIAGADLLQKALRKEQEEIKKTRDARQTLIDQMAGKIDALRYGVGVPTAPGAKLPGAGSFNAGAGGSGTAGAANEHQAWKTFYDRLADGASKAVSSFIASGRSDNKEAMPGLEKYIMGMLPKTLAVPMGPDGKPKRYSFDNSTTAPEALAKSSMTASQALQTLANIAQTSGSKLGKGLASIFGGGAGIGAGLDMFKGATSLLGKVAGIGSIASAGISAISGIFGLFKKKPKEPPPEPPKQATAEAWATFTGEQQSKAAAGILAGVSGIRVSTPEDMKAQAGIALDAYWQVFRDKGPMAAAEAFKPVRDKMLETFKAAGADDAAIAALLGPMSGQIDLAGNDAFAGAAAGMKGFADALASIANQQMPMTIDQFRAFESQAVNGYEQMKQAAIDQGLSSEEAIRNAAMASGQYLNTLRDAATKYGFDLSGSQALFDEAGRAGVSFAGSEMQSLILSLNALTETLGGAPPKFEQAMVAGATRAGRSGVDTSSSGATPASGEDMRSGFADVVSAVRDLQNRPVEVHSTNQTTLHVDGRVIADVVADEFERGGPGGTRMREALDGRG